ncbi:hypothetical protein [Chelatococcus asaccharovorans]|uniref:Uncharacterized protein n=1 Tax=Chelatococcus asaccharovorans TaxID=28210 RepID=A0A2V3UE92_9HYPH|nr:hypothetical protein [Chelatococcus asaccharovorans]MBS7707392.1 hypothetical protein [Chelatococcus asaccharovorans]PXW63572.1 hypothetical protein C7450_102490 [Chelatococcus asaccharovorans]
MSAPVLTVTPADGLIDLPRRIVVAGLKPDELVSITAHTRRRGVLDFLASCAKA